MVVTWLTPVSMSIAFIIDGDTPSGPPMRLPARRLTLEAVRLTVAAFPSRISIPAVRPRFGAESAPKVIVPPAIPTILSPADVVAALDIL